MSGLLRYWTWMAVGLLLVLMAGFLFFSKVRRGPDTAPLSKNEPSCKETEGLQRHHDTNFDPSVAQMLQALFVRTGLDPDEVHEYLGLWSNAKAPDQHDPPASSEEEMGLSLGHRDLGMELGQAIQAGLEKARLRGDDYTQAGIEYESSEAEGIEVQLVDEKVSQQLELYGKLAGNLQEMYRGEEFPRTRAQMEEILANLHHKITELKEELTQQATLCDSELGTSLDRRFYAFQEGVVQYLRSKGVFPELKGLYRPGTTELALSYKVQEVYAFLKQKNEVFVIAEQLGIQRLLQADEAEIKAMIEKALPEHLS